MSRRILPKSLRLVVRPEKKKNITVKKIIEDYLLESLELTVSDIYALQDFPATGTYDVSFHSEDVCLRADEVYRGKCETGIWEDVELEPLFDAEKRDVVVHLYNPFLEQEVVRIYLSKFCTEIDGGVKIRNQYGMYRSKIKFKVKFSTDNKGVYTLPPPFFSIAGERCSLFFSGQPPFCRTCFSYGHEKEECKVLMRCRQCGADNHMAKDCKQGRKCDLCDGSGHFARNCPEKDKAGCRIFSFADAVRGGGRARGSYVPSEIQTTAAQSIEETLKKAKALKLILECGVREEEERMEEEVIECPESTTAASITVVGGEKDGAGTLEVGVASAASCSGAVCLSESGGRKEQQSDVGRGVVEAGNMQIKALKVNLVREAELKRNLVEEKERKGKMTAKVNESQMEVGGVPEEINPVTVNINETEWGTQMDMEDSASLPLGQRVKDDESQISAYKKVKIEQDALLGMISSSDEGESPDSPIVAARRGRAGEGKMGGIEKMS